MFIKKIIYLFFAIFAFNSYCFELTKEYLNSRIDTIQNSLKRRYPTINQDECIQKIKAVLPAFDDCINNIISQYFQPTNGILGYYTYFVKRPDGKIIVIDKVPLDLFVTHPDDVKDYIVIFTLNNDLTLQDTYYRRFKYKFNINKILLFDNNGILLTAPERGKKSSQIFFYKNNNNILSIRQKYSVHDFINAFGPLKIVNELEIKYKF